MSVIFSFILSTFSLVSNIFQLLFLCNFVGTSAVLYDDHDKCRDEKFHFPHTCSPCSARHAPNWSGCTFVLAPFFQHLTGFAQQQQKWAKKQTKNLFIQLSVVVWTHKGVHSKSGAHSVCGVVGTWGIFKLYNSKVLRIFEPWNYQKCVECGWGDNLCGIQPKLAVTWLSGIKCLYVCVWVRLNENDFN
jgi:hypothetical protein